jgi:diguanylate cyclase (GGDEF)-like protein
MMRWNLWPLRLNDSSPSLSLPDDFQSVGEKPLGDNNRKPEARVSDSSTAFERQRDTTAQCVNLQPSAELTHLSVSDLIAKNLLRAVFQPIFSFAGGEILGYESLIRGPQGSTLECPLALREAAGREDLSIEFERSAARIGLERFIELKLPGRIFLNYSAAALAALVQDWEHVLPQLKGYGFATDRIVIEITERAWIANPEQFAASVSLIRECGVGFAMDDYGAAQSSLSLWVALRPEFVKIDKYFITNVARDPMKYEALRSIMRFAFGTGTRLIADGVEKEEDMKVVRDLGISFGQGFFFACPAEIPTRQVSVDARLALESKSIAVFPLVARVFDNTVRIGELLIDAPTVDLTASNNDVLALFEELSDRHAVAVLDGRLPVALINRRKFVDRFTRAYYRELFGRRSCLQFANRTPLMVETSATASAMTHLLTREDQGYLEDGFVFTAGGHYAGLGRGDELARKMMELRVEAARYANPLTFLPGNVPIDEHIRRLLGAGAPFTACYVDLSHFKSFNDRYGYWKGDRVLELAAKHLSDAIDPSCDFVGHIGGDDFLVLFQSEGWRGHANVMMTRFNQEVVHHYEDEDAAAGGIVAENRRGQPEFHPVVTMAVGALIVPVGTAKTATDVSGAAARVKLAAKRSASGFACATYGPLTAPCLGIPFRSPHA